MMNYKQLKELFCRQEREHSGTHLTGCITFSSFGSNNKQHYPWCSRTYVISSDNKAFQPGKCGYSIFGSCLDGTDCGLRLSEVMRDEHGGEDGWVVENCFVIGYLLTESSDTGNAASKLFYSRDEATGYMLSQLAENGELDVKQLRADRLAGKASYEEGVYAADRDSAFLSGQSVDLFWNIEPAYIYDLLHIVFPASQDDMDGIGKGVQIAL